MAQIDCFADTTMFDDTTKKIGAGALAGLVTIFITAPSGHGVCIDPRIWCGPPPADHGDEPARDGPGPLRAGPMVAASLSSGKDVGLGSTRFASGQRI